MSLTVQGLFIESLFSRKRHTFLSFTSHYKRTQFLNKLKVQKDQCCSLFQCFSVSVLAHLFACCCLKIPTSLVFRVMSLVAFTHWMASCRWLLSRYHETLYDVYVVCTNNFISQNSVGHNLPTCPGVHVTEVLVECKSSITPLFGV